MTAAVIAALTSDLRRLLPSPRVASVTRAARVLRRARALHDRHAATNDIGLLVRLRDLVDDAEACLVEEILAGVDPARYLDALRGIQQRRRAAPEEEKSTVAMLGCVWAATLRSAIAAALEEKMRQPAASPCRWPPWPSPEVSPDSTTAG